VARKNYADVFLLSCAIGAFAMHFGVIA